MASSTTESTSDSITTCEKNLESRLHSAFNITCEKFVSSVKFSRLKKNFAEIYKKNPDDLRSIHNQLCSQLKKNISEDLDHLSKKYSIDILLNSLEVILKHQDPSQCSWRPSGNPEDDLRDHIYPLKVKHKEALKAILFKCTVANEELTNEIEVNHAEIMHIKKLNDEMYEKFSCITSSLTGTNLKNLQETLDSKADY